MNNTRVENKRKDREALERQTKEFYSKGGAITYYEGFKDVKGTKAATDGKDLF